MSDAFQPVYSHNGTYDDYWNTRPVRRYGRILNNQLSRDPAEQAYRVRAYEDIGNQTIAAQDQARFGGAQAFGFNNPSGIPLALSMQANMSAPYGKADMEAQEAGRQSAQNTGQAILNMKQMHANWYQTLMGPWLQNKNIESQMQIAQMQAAAAAAAAGGGG